MKLFFKITTVILCIFCFVTAIISFVLAITDPLFVAYGIGLIIGGLWNVGLYLYLKELDNRDIALLSLNQNQEKSIARVSNYAERLELRIVKLDKLLYEMENNEEYQAVKKKQQIADLEKQLEELKKDDN